MKDDRVFLALVIICAASWVAYCVGLAYQNWVAAPAGVIFVLAAGTIVVTGATR